MLSVFIGHSHDSFSNVTDTFTTIVPNREWVGSHANASRFCSLAGQHGNESLCMISKEKTRCAIENATTLSSYQYNKNVSRR